MRASFPGPGRAWRAGSLQPAQKAGPQDAAGCRRPHERGASGTSDPAPERCRDGVGRSTGRRIPTGHGTTPRTYVDPSPARRDEESTPGKRIHLDTEQRVRVEMAVHRVTGERTVRTHGGLGVRVRRDPRSDPQRRVRRAARRGDGRRHRVPRGGPGVRPTARDARRARHDRRRRVLPRKGLHRPPTSPRPSVHPHLAVHAQNPRHDPTMHPGRRGNRRATARAPSYPPHSRPARPRARRRRPREHGGIKDHTPSTTSNEAPTTSRPSTARDALAFERIRGRCERQQTRETHTCDACSGSVTPRRIASSVPRPSMRRG